MKTGRIVEFFNQKSTGVKLSIKEIFTVIIRKFSKSANLCQGGSVSLDTKFLPKYGFFIIFDLISTTNPKFAQIGTAENLNFFLYPEYDLGLSQSLITSSFG